MNGWVSQQWNGHLKCKLELNMDAICWCFVMFSERDGLFLDGFQKNMGRLKQNETKLNRNEEFMSQTIKCTIYFAWDECYTKG